MPRLSLNTDEADLTVEALRAEADRRRRAAERAAAQLTADRRAGADVRSRAVKVIDLLGTADELEQIATRLTRADAPPELMELTLTEAGTPIPTGTAYDDLEPTVLPDGTAPAGDPDRTRDLTGEPVADDDDTPDQQAIDALENALAGEDPKP